MYLNPFVAVAIVLVGILSAMVGNRLLRSASISESHRESQAGSWFFTAGLIAIMGVFIFDPTAVFQAGPEFTNWVRDFLTS